MPYIIYVYVRNVHVHTVWYKAAWSRMKWFVRQFVDGSMEILTRLMNEDRNLQRKNFQVKIRFFD